MIRHRDHHKGFKRRTPEELAERQRKRDEKAEARGAVPRSKNARTLQHDIWEKEWKEEHRHIRNCESCGQGENYSDPDSRLTMMHALKRNKIGSGQADRADYMRAAKVCWGEHRRYDEATGPDVHERMADFVDGLIEKRPPKPKPFIKLTSK